MSNYKESKKLSIDLAEKILSLDMSDMFISDSKDKAKNIRILSEISSNQSKDIVQKFLNIEHNCFCIVVELLEGFNGYKLIKEGE